MSTYINGKVFGLPKPTKHSPSKPRPGRAGNEYITVVTIGGSTYFKVQLGRQLQFKSKYFKTRDQARLFVDMLRINNYL